MVCAQNTLLAYLWLILEAASAPLKVVLLSLLIILVINYQFGS
jgi:hypothetical protein